MIHDKVVLIENFSFLKINVSKIPHEKLKIKLFKEFNKDLCLLRRL